MDNLKHFNISTDHENICWAEIDVKGKSVNVLTQEVMTDLANIIDWLETNTKIKNDEQQNNEYDDDEPDYLAQSNVANDGAFDYGAGFGVRFPIFRGGDNGPVFICLEMKWSKGGEAEYLNAGKDGAIVLSDPADGPVTTTLNPDKSKTDLFNISIGIGF